MKEEKGFTPDHTADSIAAALGLTDTRLDELVSRGIDAYNQDSETKSLQIHNAARAIRDAFFGKCDVEPSQYEIVLAYVAFDMGKKQVMSVVHSIMGMCAKLPLPKEIVNKVVLSKIIEYMQGETGEHECTKCGKCGKTFDGDGNQTGGPDMDDDS